MNGRDIGSELLSAETSAAKPNLGYKDDRNKRLESGYFSDSFCLSALFASLALSFGDSIVILVLSGRP
jgi:hypothetical protein